VATGLIADIISATGLRMILIPVLKALSACCPEQIENDSHSYVKICDPTLPALRQCCTCAPIMRTSTGPLEA
jgi:hypothetical protein